MTGILPFWCYFGGKWRVAPRYPKPLYNTIVEPFAGAAGYSLRYPERRVVLVEKDESLVALWLWLIHAKANDFLRLPDVPEGATTDDLAVSAEARSLIGFWLCKGVTRAAKQPSSWMRGGSRPRSYWGPEVRAKLAAQAGRISHWKILQGDYTQAPEVEATWFVDPPYQKAGRAYRCSSRDIDYDALGKWCLGRQGQTLVCENTGATWLPFSDFVVTRGTPGKGRKGRSSEALWVNTLVVQK